MVEDVFTCEKDSDLGKVVKYMKPNPLGTDAHLMPDGTVVFDEHKIIRAQQIFKENWYRPGGPGARKACEKFTSRTGQGSDATQ
jgi:hypothetical protein